MRRCLVLLFALLPLAAAAGEPAGKGDKAGLKEGNNLPGPFYPYNVTGPHKGHFHCVVSEHGLRPAVLVFHRGLDANGPFKDFLKQLDATLAKNQRADVAGYVVFIAEDLPEVFGANDKDDDKREELATRIDDLAKALALKNLVLCLDSPSDVEKYGLGGADVTVILYNKLRVVKSDALRRDQLTEGKIKEVVNEVSERLGAKRKK